MIPGNGVNRVRRRLFEEDVAEEDTSKGGSGLVSVSSLFKLLIQTRQRSET